MIVWIVCADMSISERIFIRYDQTLSRPRSWVSHYAVPISTNSWQVSGQKIALLQPGIARVEVPSLLIPARPVDRGTSVGAPCLRHDGGHREQ